MSIDLAKYGIATARYQVEYTTEHGGTSTFFIDATSYEMAVPLAVRHVQHERQSGDVPALRFIDAPLAQAVFDQFAATQQGGGGNNLDPGQIDLADAIGVYRNKETGRLEVWIDQMTVFGGEYPDTDQGQVDAAARADEMRAGRV